METGSVRWTIITTPKGRIMDVIKVAKMADHLFVGLSPQRAQSIIHWIDFYTFGEDIRVEVQIKEAAPLTNPLELANEKLTGSEFIDLRE